MSITNELRKYVKDHTNWDVALTTYPPQRTMTYYEGAMDVIADRIDAAHEEALVSSYFDGVFSDEELAENGFVRLPKDADGEYIHIGDRMENGERVERIVLTDGSWEPSVYLAKTPHVLREYFCNEISHYHEPTVEDVLREFVYAILNQKPEFREKNIAEYAKRLKLVGDAE